MRGCRAGCLSVGGGNAGTWPLGGEGGRERGGKGGRGCKAGCFSVGGGYALGERKEERRRGRRKGRKGGGEKKGGEGLDDRRVHVP